ncbi:MAG: UvrD-helicase domain-containing protein, partial [Myxococcales bacterium]|nr:UvrD-helicase domain-containing protein [Myxococcales bacterium]
MTPRRVARPSVLRGIPLDRHAVIEASAGTGKTFTLEHLVVELLLATDVTLDRVLVVSFTEKATLEIRARVRAKLEELVGGGPPPDAAQTAAGDFWTIDEGAQRKLERSLRAFDSVVVATIHAFCQRVLRENAFASGRLFAEQQVDGRDAFARAFREALRREVAPDAARARWLDAALRSGWSIGRVEEQLWKCVDSHGELRPQVDLESLDAAVAAFPLQAALQPGLLASLQRLGMKTQTASAVLKRLVGLAGAIEEGVAAGGTPGYVLRAEALDLGYLAGALPPFASGPTPAAALCAAALALARTTPSLLAALAHAVLPAVTTELARRKREAGQYDFDDMLTLVARALGGEHGRALAATMRERWRYVLIDEFQDTDETQWSIFRQAFFEESSVSPERPSSHAAAPGPQSLLYLVGDPKQSIYRFRGADVHTYLRARDAVVAAGGARVTLDRNFRATPALVEATNAIFDADAECPVFSGDIRHEPASSGRPDR